MALTKKFPEKAKNRCIFTVPGESGQRYKRWELAGDEIYAERVLPSPLYYRTKVRMSGIVRR